MAGTDAAHPADVAAVSICIPAYNGALYLEECLASALAQSVGDIEVVVVDDASTDKTVALADGFARGDKRVRVFRNPTRLGLVENWNRSIQHCTGEWIKFLFQDDCLRRDCLEQMLGAARSSRGGGPFRWVVCERRFVIENDAGQDLRRFYENGVVRLGEIFPDRGPIRPLEFSTAIVEKGVGTNFVGEPTSVMIRRDLCSEYGGFNSNLIHLCDLEYWTRIGTNEPMVYVPRALCNFRVHGSSASARNHSCRRFQVAYLDKIVLLHDYLYHPLYENFRKTLHPETLLRTALKGAMRGLMDLTAGPNHAEKEHLEAMYQRYPLLRRHLEERHG